MEQFDSSVEESSKVSEPQQKNNEQQCPRSAAELTEADWKFRIKPALSSTKIVFYSPNTKAFYCGVVFLSITTHWLLSSPNFEMEQDV